MPKNNFGPWRSKRHAVVDLSLTALFAIYIVKKIRETDKEMASWDAAAQEMKSDASRMTIVV